MTQTCVIIGATSEVGMQLAPIYAQNGYNLHLLARKPQKLDSLKSHLEIKQKIKVTISFFDALDFKSHHNLFQPIATHSDVVIFLVGILGNQKEGEHNLDHAFDIMDTNYKSGISILSIFANQYEAQQKGTIIGVSSVAGERGRQSNYLYGSAKAGFTAFLDGLRNRLSKANVHVITVLPGFMATQMTAHLELPKLLMASPQQAAKAIYKSHQKKKNRVYVIWLWRYIMLVIKNIPEFLFKKLSL